MRGEAVAPEIYSSLNLGLDIRIPQDYIGDEQQRLKVYKRIADAGEPAKAESLLSELADRYGPVPESLTHLVAFSQLKTLAAQTGIEAIDRRGGGVNIKFHPGAAIDPQKLMALISTQPGVQFTPREFCGFRCRRLRGRPVAPVAAADRSAAQLAAISHTGTSKKPSTEA